MSTQPIRLLQFGVSGQLGRALVRQERNVTTQALSRAEADFSRPQNVREALRNADACDVVVNATAYTAVDDAEKEEKLAARINVEAVEILAAFCAERGIPLIHISTDYVFDGEKTGPYRETDSPHPLNAYGRTKLAGEDAIRKATGPHVILRTSWLYSVFGKNFVKTMLRLGAERDELRVVADQHGTPTAAGDLAAAIHHIAHAVAGAPAPECFGTFHYAGGGETTWYEFAKAIFEEAHDWVGIRAKLTPIPSEDYQQPARRPHNSRLDCAKIETVYGLTPVPWRHALRQVLTEIKAAGESAS